MNLKDQYGRAVGAVTYRGRFGLRRSRDISQELLAEGLAVIYRSGGAQYGQWPLERWERLEAQAQKSKKGIWSKGVANVQLPSEYKKKAR